MDVIIIAGMPASGKSTLARKIGAALGYPILEKDELKEEIFDTVGFSSYAEKRKIDHAATAVLLRAFESLLAGGTSVILVNNFDTASAERLGGMLARYDCRTVTVFLGGDNDVFYRRYVERDRLRLRHVGHAVQEHYPLRDGESPDYEMTREEFAEKFEKRGMGDFRCAGARIDLDATDPAAIDAERLVSRIRELLGAG